MNHNCRARWCDTPHEWSCQCHTCLGCHENYNHSWRDWNVKPECEWCLEEMAVELEELKNDEQYEEAV
jgi:hypothetical protein